MKVRKKIISFSTHPPAQRAFKTPFLMEIIWSILRSAFFKTRNTVVVCALQAGLFFGTKRNRLVFCTLQSLEWGILWFFCALYVVLLEQGILCFLCILCGAFRTRNTLFYEHFMQCFWNEEYPCCLCTSPSAFRSMNTLVVCALHTVL